ncbi:MAG: penicillin-binding protein 2 [Methyloligellaceae bacterium]
MTGSDRSRMLGQRFTRRAMLLGVGQTGLFGVLGWRLHQLQILDAPKYALLAEENRINVQLVAPTRGVIVDRFGEVIAANRESLRVVIVPDLVRDVAGTLERLSRIIEISDEKRERALRLARRQSAYIPIVVADDVSWREFAQINIMAPSLPGVQTDIWSVRDYNHGHDMAHIVGYVGAANKAEVLDDPVVRLPGFRIGKSGVEKGFERTLRGQAGNVKLEVNAYGRALRKLEHVSSRPGREVVLTIDRQIQRVAMARIAEQRRAAVVALDVQTGEIIAMASNPSYDPNDIVYGVNADRWADLAKAKDNPLMNRAIRGQYPPGSTFKMVTALAGLEAGVITPKTKMYCGGGLWYVNRLYRCWKRRGHRGVRLHLAIKQSCDTYFYETARRMGIRKLAVTARKLGLGQTYDCGLPLQKPGVVPDPDWKRLALAEPWYGGETISAAIGQGYVLTTPLQLAVMTARIATSRQVVPRIVRPYPDEKMEPFERVDIKEEYLELVRKGMYGVVNEGGGTAGRSRLQTPDVKMAGKTGTSQVTKKSIGRKSHQLKWKERDHALFVAYAPADAPRYALAVIVEHGGSGSRAAAPVARDIMTAIIERDPLSKPAHVAKDAKRKTAEDLRRRDEG